MGVSLARGTVFPRRVEVATFRLSGYCNCGQLRTAGVVRDSFVR
jgi:hypothetical protein